LLGQVVDDLLNLFQRVECGCLQNMRVPRSAESRTRN
jgi:hypothetical protein